MFKSRREIIFEELLKVLEEEIKEGVFDASLILRSRLLLLLSISSGIQSTLYLAGKKFGLEVLSSMIEGESLSEILENSLPLIEKLVGKAEVEVMNQKVAVLRVYDSLTAKNAVNIGQTLDHFEAGMLAGIVEGKLKKRVVAFERKCKATGSEHCEFWIKIID